MCKQIKIAFLGNQIAWGGGAKSLLLMIRALSALNYKLFLYVTNCANQEMKSEFEKHVEFIKIISLPELTSAQTESKEENIQAIDYSSFNRQSLTDFVNELNENKIDILHINNSVFSPIYKDVREGTAVKIVTHVREWIQWNGIHEKQSFIIENILKFSDALLCISNIEASTFSQHSLCRILPNPFDFGEISLMNSNQEQVKLLLGIDRGWLLVGMMSSFQENKGILDFFKALVYLKKTKSDIQNLKFVYLGRELKRGNLILFYLRKVLGKNSYLRNLLQFIKENNLKEDIISFSNRGNIYEIVNCFDIAVRPSFSGDPWGRDIIEYMALAKPIVATGFSDFYIKDGLTGFLVPPGNIVQLSEKIYELFKNERERNDMGSFAFEIVNEKCNIKKFTQDLCNVYNLLIEKHNSN